MTTDGPPPVRQYGPRIDSQGGMAAALEAYSHLPLRRYRFEFVPTWEPEARLWGVRLFLMALLGMLRHRAARRAIHHFHLSVRGSFVREGALAAAASLLGAPVVISLHGGEIASFLERHPRLARTVFARADMLITLGPETRSIIEPFVRPRTHIVTIPNPVEVPDDTSPAGAQPEITLFAGEVRLLKGVDVLVDAWARVRHTRPRARLVVAGRPGDFEPVDAEGVEWLGTLARERVVELLAEVRVAVLPSRVEVMPMFLLEAMAAARPVVTTPVGEVPSLVEGIGRLVPVGDAGALASALLEYLGDPDLATLHGAALRRRVEDQFAPGPVAAHLESAYDELLATRASDHAQQEKRSS